MVEQLQSGDKTMAPEESACSTYRNWMLLFVLKSDEFKITSREPHLQVWVSPEYELHNLQNKS